MTTRKRHGGQVQYIPVETSAVPARWEAPGKIEILSQPPEEAIETTSLADALVREQVAEPGAAAATFPAIGEAQSWRDHIRDWAR